MNSLKQTFSRPLREVKSSAVILILIVALVGFADAGYLTLEHYQGRVPPCSVTKGCEQVLTSDYSSVAGIPVSLLGSLYYLAVAVGSFIYLESKHGGALNPRHEAVLRWTLRVTILGFVASLWFIYLQAFVIHSWCAYCLGSALTSTLLFIAACVILNKYKYTNE